MNRFKLTIISVLVGGWTFGLIRNGSVDTSTTAPVLLALGWLYGKPGGGGKDV